MLALLSKLFYVLIFIPLTNDFLLPRVFLQDTVLLERRKNVDVKKIS